MKVTDWYVDRDSKLKSIQVLNHWEISWVADKRLESQEELCHVELEQVILNILPS
jgi:hypothetical protein